MFCLRHTHLQDNPICSVPALVFSILVDKWLLIADSTAGPPQTNNTTYTV